MPQFETVFDGTRFHVSAELVIGLVSVGVGVLVLVNPPIIQRWTRAYRGKIPISRLGLTGVLCASLWIAFVGIGEHNGNVKCRALLAGGKFSVAEGPIYNAWSRAKTQGFSVNGVNFSYSYSIITGGYNGALVDSPIREGRYVRIYYTGDFIIKIETRR